MSSTSRPEPLSDPDIPPDVAFDSRLNESNTVAALDATDIEVFLAGIGMSDLCNELGAERILDSCRNVRNPYEN